VPADERPGVVVPAAEREVADERERILRQAARRLERNRLGQELAGLRGRVRRRGRVDGRGDGVVDPEVLLLGGGPQRGADQPRHVRLPAAASGDGQAAEPGEE